ncbi:hypothetical protein [Natronococcus jeotgali]|uniref:Uncharacterized protein n=1 Tax=Natronococcus jeotgali DSM 18795 TaxID=1227498 RepID=L9Y023_9EURY|nr:hypothetical protein [Natronococcus jeotgali]ELY67400.1 hypothetical protein C492_00065 [Natronococcus jeotgali DSM 18795]
MFALSLEFAHLQVGVDPADNRHRGQPTLDVIFGDHVFGLHFDDQIRVDRVCREVVQRDHVGTLLAEIREHLLPELEILVVDLAWRRLAVGRGNDLLAALGVALDPRRVVDHPHVLGDLDIAFHGGIQHLRVETRLTLPLIFARRNHVRRGDADRPDDMTLIGFDGRRSRIGALELDEVLRSGRPVALFVRCLGSALKADREQRVRPPKGNESETSRPRTERVVRRVIDTTVVWVSLEEHR